MKNDLIRLKMNDLDYKMNLEKYAFERAVYQLDYAKELKLSDAEISKLCNSLDEYSKKYANDKCTYDVLNDYMSSKKSDNCSELLFKCTLPCEKAAWNGEYQSSIVVNENVAKLFANGVDYRAVLNCLDADDILSINTEFDAHDTRNNKKGNVDVELAEDSDYAIDDDEDVIVASSKENGWSTIVAASKVPYCLPIDDVSLSDLNGKKYEIVVPSLDSIEELRSDITAKTFELDRLMSLEAIVKDKIDTTVMRMNYVLDNIDKNS